MSNPFDKTTMSADNIDAPLYELHHYLDYVDKDVIEVLVKWRGKENLVRILTETRDSINFTLEMLKDA